VDMLKTDFIWEALYIKIKESKMTKDIRSGDDEEIESNFFVNAVDDI
jgi:hypothetical protein